MANATLSKLLEGNLVEAIEAESWAGSSVAPAYGSMGAQLITFPSIRVQCESGSETPSSSGNFRCTVRLIVYGGLDPDNSSDYDGITEAHETLCGNMEDFVTTLTNSELENTVSGYSNNLDVYDIRWISFERDIDTGAGLFEDVFQIEITCRRDV